MELIVGGSRLSFLNLEKLRTCISRRGPYYYYPDGMITSYPRRDIPEEWWLDDDQVPDEPEESQ